MLRRAADTAMYRIKGGAKGGAALFDSDMGRDMTVRMAQEQRLRLAVRDGHFCCAFQPKVDMHTEEVAGVEALIRLRDADGVIQARGEFIGLAAKLGLIDDLTYLALEQILKSMQNIRAAGYRQRQRCGATSKRLRIHARLLPGDRLERLCRAIHHRSHQGRLPCQEPLPEPRLADAARSAAAGLHLTISAPAIPRWRSLPISPPTN